MEHNGWIKLHRKLLDKGYWNKSQYVHLWLHLLLEANHKSKEFMWNGSMIMVKEGQLITGRKELSRATGIPETTVERILQMLENEHQIGQQKTNKYRLITIVNWEQYQNRTPERTTNGQQADTNKNDKNEKKNTYPSQAQDLVEKREEEDPEYFPPGKKKKEPLAAVSDVLDIWNSYPNWKATGKTSAPVNATAIKRLLPLATYTNDLKLSIQKKRNKYTLAEIEQAIKAYIVEIANRPKGGYQSHRFSAYEFFTYPNGLTKYANR